MLPEVKYTSVDGTTTVGYGDTAVNLTDGVTSDADGRFVYENADGTKYKYATDGNGNLTSITLYDENGNIVDTKNFDIVNGGISSTYSYKDGRLIETRYTESGEQLVLEYDSFDSAGNPVGNPTTVEFLGGNGEKCTAIEVDGSYLVKDSTGKIVITSVDYDKIAPYVAASGAGTTLSSGDTVKIAESSYTVYGFASTNSGEVIPMYADADGNLYYTDNSGAMQPVMETYQRFNGITFTDVSVPATIDSVDAEHISYYTTMDGVAAEYPSYSSLSIGELATVDASSDVLGTATFTNGTMNENVSLESTEGMPYAGINTSNAVTTAGPKLSYEDEFTNTVNGVNFTTATGMNSFTDLVANPQENQSYVIKIPQNQYVQWDSPDGGTGYEFDTTNSVYLKWNPEANGYQIVDEYGNVTNDRVFGLDGFNNNGGANGGVWE